MGGKYEYNRVASPESVSILLSSPDTITISNYRQIPNLPPAMLPTGTLYLTIFRQYLLGKSNQVIHSCFVFLQHNKYSAQRLGLDSKHVILNGLISVIGAFS